MSSTSGYHAHGILIDTSGYFAVANRRDTHHHAGVRTLRQILVERRPLFTTNLILAETHALLLTRVGRDIAARVLAEIDNSRMTTIVRVGEADDARARDIIRQYRDKSFSLTDATSFAVMERLGIVQAFTFDVNFAQ